MTLQIESRRWLAVWYRCPKCGAQSGRTRLTPTRRHRDYVPECDGWQCNDCAMEIVARRYYTTFCIEYGITATTVAGTLAELGPFRICNYVYPNIRVFRRVIAEKMAEREREMQECLERERKMSAEYEGRRKREQEAARLVKEAEAVAYRQAHAVKLAAEQIASAACSEQELPVEDDYPF